MATIEMSWDVQQYFFEKYADEFTSQEYGDMYSLCSSRFRDGWDRFKDKMYLKGDLELYRDEKEEEADRLIYRFARKHKEEMWQEAHRRHIAELRKAADEESPDRSNTCDDTFIC